MTTKENKPLFRVLFARISGQDENGKDRLGPARQIGTVWPRSEGEGAILRFDHIPAELTQHAGVIFLNKPEPRTQGESA